VVVGGPPALLSSANETQAVYINDGRQMSASDSSSWMLEWDSVAQRPDTFAPLPFIGQQLQRVFYPETLKQAEATGFFPQQSMDWSAWLGTPAKWASGLRLARSFQAAAGRTAVELELADRDIAGRCKANQAFLDELNTSMKGKLYLFGRRGALIYTRNKGKTFGSIIRPASRCIIKLLFN
jgi:hypothetical protein